MSRTFDRTNAERQRRYRERLKAAAARTDRLEEEIKRLLVEQRWLKLQRGELLKKIAEAKRRGSL